MRTLTVYSLRSAGGRPFAGAEVAGNGASSAISWGQHPFAAAILFRLCGEYCVREGALDITQMFCEVEAKLYPKLTLIQTDLIIDDSLAGRLS